MQTDNISSENEHSNGILGAVSGSVNVLQWKCSHCNTFTDEYKAITDRNGMDRCPKCNTVYGGSPKHYR